MSCATKSTNSLATPMLVMAVLLSCGVRTPVPGQGGGRDDSGRKVPALPKERPARVSTRPSTSPTPSPGTTPTPSPSATPTPNPSTSATPSPTPSPPRDDVGELISKGVELNRQGKHDDAILRLTEAINLDRKRVAAHYQRGDAFYDKTDYDSAIGDYTEAIKLDPGYADAYYSRARAQVARGSKGIDSAIADFTKAIEIDPQFGEAYRERGYLVLAKRVAKNMRDETKGGFEEGLRDLAKAMEIDPNDALAYLYRGQFYLMSGSGEPDLELVIGDFTTAIRLDPKSWLAYHWRGVVRLGQNEYELAVKDLSNAIGLNPNFGGTYFYRSQAYEKLGRKESAAADKQKWEQLKGPLIP